MGLDNQKGMFFDELKERGADLHVGSVTDSDMLDRLSQGCERIFHLAAAFRKVNLPKKVYWDVNVNGTRNVLAAARKHGVSRILYCSTCGVHGNVENFPAGEDAAIAPADWYQETKWQGEVVCKEFIEQGMWITIVRPAAIYGPGDPERFVMLYKRAAKGRFIMVGDGSTQYHPLYISNLIDAMQRAIESDAAKGNAYLVADESSIAIKDLVNAIGGVLGRKIRFIHVPYWPVYCVALACEIGFKLLPAEPPLFRRRVDWFIQNRSFDISAAKRDLGYQPAVDLRTGLTYTAEWYKEQRLIQA